MTTQFLDTKEVAEMIGISPNTLAAWRSMGKGPPYMQIGQGAVRYKEADIVEWMESQYVQSSLAVEDVFEPESEPTPVEEMSDEDKLAEAERLLDSVEDLEDLTTKELLLVLSALKVEPPKRARKTELIDLVMASL